MMLHKAPSSFKASSANHVFVLHMSTEYHHSHQGVLLALSFPLLVFLDLYKHIFSHISIINSRCLFTVVDSLVGGDGVRVACLQSISILLFLIFSVSLRGHIQKYIRSSVYATTIMDSLIAFLQLWTP